MEDEEDQADAFPTEKLVDVIVLDSPFATFRGMIHDVIHSQFKVCGCCINLALSGVLKDCKKKINKDLTLIKPIEAVPFIEVPAFYMVGKGDIIARPEKVKELFLHTKSPTKEYHTFEGEHPTHRDKYILKKAILFILQEFDRLALRSVPSSLPEPEFESKKARAKHRKDLVDEHKRETFLDPPIKAAKKPAKPESSEEVELPELGTRPLDPVKTTQPGPNLDVPKEQPMPMGPSPTPPQPKTDLESMSRNLDQHKTPDIEKQPLAMSFSENAPPVEFKAPLDEMLPAPSDLKPAQSPVVTGNSSPQ